MALIRPGRGGESGSGGRRRPKPPADRAPAGPGAAHLCSRGTWPTRRCWPARGTRPWTPASRPARTGCSAGSSAAAGSAAWPGRPRRAAVWPCAAARVGSCKGATRSTSGASKRDALSGLGLSSRSTATKRDANCLSGYPRKPRLSRACGGARKATTAFSRAGQTRTVIHECRRQHDRRRPGLWGHQLSAAGSAGGEDGVAILNGFVGEDALLKRSRQPRLEGSRGKSVPGAPQEEQGGRCGRSESGEQGRQSQEGSRQGPEHVRPYALP